jgi:hypothetical protein
MILGFRAAIIADFGQNRKHEDLRASIAADTLKQLGKQAKTASSRRMQRGPKEQRCLCAWSTGQRINESIGIALHEAERRSYKL